MLTVVCYSEDDLIPMAEEVHSHWSDETNYGQLLEHTEVRDRIVAAGQRYKPQITGEEVLAVFDLIVPCGVPLEKLAKLLVPIYDKLGIRTGKSASLVSRAAPGRVIVAVLCALTSSGQTLTRVEQATNGCILTASIPSSIFALVGEMVISVQHEGGQTTIEAAVKIPGQLYDWGKSQRILNHLFQQTSTYAA